ncbi:hypothetical protein [Helicobacter pylori]|uniref:Uncharacterized protein n=1 Tax=Helicobacter pylori (strain SouthAfrica7) TaxID=907239 RepID=E8QSJ9_HELPW|nr:hypothetical protein [Helicobacter pylori]ADU84963.1 hypothetical protein HPSA_04930 [Helicobacter pylori SouthAfrica7]WQU99006.1 hypothetical protein KVK26_04865 [Helicobacter pylori]
MDYNFLKPEFIADFTEGEREKQVYKSAYKHSKADRVTKIWNGGRPNLTDTCYFADAF